MLEILAILAGIAVCAALVPLARRNRALRAENARLGEDVALPDGTRLHDQKIATADGARWIAWHDVMARAQAGERLEIQSVGRDITDRVEAERALAEARDQAEAASLAKSRFLAMV